MSEKEKKAIEYFEGFTKYTENRAIEEYRCECKNIQYAKDLEKRASIFKTILNLIEKQDKTIKCYEETLEKQQKEIESLEYIKKNFDYVVEKRTEEKDKIIDEMAEKLAKYYNMYPHKCIFKGKGKGKEEWGAEPNKEYYILEILEIIEIKNWDNPNPSKVKEAMAVAALPATASITPIEDMQKEITKAINKQIGINIDIEEGINRSGQARKNMMMFGG